ncbi:MAG: HAMP domain-containing histidine kinase [Deltaproteobacteria bacterium]|nr:HAMP domain-containing histidine kinase [Deltaproteobacteria bacterium]
MKEAFKTIDRIAHDMASSIMAIRFFLNKLLNFDPTAKLEELRDSLRESLRNIKDDAKLNSIIREISESMRSEIQFIEKAAASIQKADDETIERLCAAKRSIDKIKAMADNLKKAGECKEALSCQTSVARIIKGTIEELRPVLGEKNISLDFIYNSEAIVNIDESTINRVISNMIVNASEAMSEGDIAVHLHTHEDVIRIEVVDNGKGILDRIAPKIFKQGFTFGKKDGTGTGLAFCEEAVNSHGGRLAVHSRSKQGSIFAVSLPAKRETPTLDEDSVE